MSKIGHVLRPKPGGHGRCTGEKPSNLTTSNGEAGRRRADSQIRTAPPVGLTTGFFGQRTVSTDSSPMPTYDFGKTVVLITGAARGIGRAHALAFAESGADLALLDLGGESIAGVDHAVGTGPELEAVAEETASAPGRTLSLTADVTSQPAVERAVEETIEELGRIDVLVNNAGVFPVGSLHELEESAWDAVLNTNLKGTWLCAKHVSRHLIDRGEGGAIVNTASTSGLKGVPPGLGHYIAAKHGVVGLTKAQAMELAPHDIRVNAVAPTIVDTPGIETVAETYGTETFIEGGLELAGPANMLDPGDAMAPADVCEAVKWLASDAARYVTGITLPVDAGYTAK